MGLHGRRTQSCPPPPLQPDPPFPLSAISLPYKSTLGPSVRCVATKVLWERDLRCPLCWGTCPPCSSRRRSIKRPARCLLTRDHGRSRGRITKRASNGEEERVISLAAVSHCNAMVILADMDRRTLVSVISNSFHRLTLAEICFQFKQGGWTGHDQC